MVLIPAGTFQMGSNEEKPRDDEHPVRTVYVEAFYMDTTEVTNAQFKAFVDANPAWQKDRIEARFASHGRYLQVACESELALRRKTMLKTARIPLTTVLCTIFLMMSAAAEVVHIPDAEPPRSH